MVDDSAGMWISWTSARAVTDRVVRATFLVASCLRDPENELRVAARDADRAMADMMTVMTVRRSFGDCKVQP
tara:strand:- start:3530 stop:3745 length:216 start_codon:yes stop_codon:yes gene_type:complete